MERKRMRPIAYAIKAEDDGESAEIRIYDDIGPDMFGEGLTASRFASDLAGLGGVSQLNVRINSQGGDVFDANAIYNELVRHPAKVTVDIDGMALSAASVVAMAGDKIRMAKNAVMMIHNPWTVTIGDAEQHRDAGDVLDIVRDTLVEAYRAQTGKTKASIKKMLDSETWLNADEAKSEGFVDEVITRPAVAAAFDPSVCRKLPPAWAVERMAAVVDVHGFVPVPAGAPTWPIKRTAPASPHRWLDARRRLAKQTDGV